MKKLRRFIQMWDVIWAPLAAFGAFVFVGLVLQGIFRTEEGSSAGFYDPSFIQAGFYATALVVLFSGAALFGKWLNFRGYWRYIYSKESSSKEDFKQLTPWQKFFISHFSYYFYVVVMLIVWITLV